ncbi:hypothetical protein O181_055021 [Austropuccinia psidii MF-1]|uniref:Uncharacterized protein n=1 Tax=Austropuccinia psidii MF-1 TaxID=1389203 RepID=A0A9Q3HRP0_9BASI|nr:hypothetical protein [Austropuccinia psidii MF-1]
MEATIQSNQMDLEKEEARPGPDLESPPQERHVWRILGFPPIPQGLKHFQVEAIEIYQSRYRNWYRAAKEEEWEICPSLWRGGMSSYVHIKSFLCQEKTIDLLGGGSPLSCKIQGQKDEELVEEPKSFIHRPDKGIGNDHRFGERRTSGVYQLQKSSINVQRQTQGTSEEAERSQEPSRQGKRTNQLAQTLPTRVQDPQIGAFSHGQCFQYGQNSYGIHSQIAGKDEQDFSMKIIDEINFIKSNIELQPCKFDAKLTKITSDINYLKKNDIVSSEWHESTIDRLHLI